MANALPEVMSLKPYKSVDTMSVDTEILDPVVITDEFCRFQLQNKGVLNVNSQIQLSCVTDQATRGYSLPFRTGIHALIKSAAFKIGTQTISSVDEYALYQQCARQFKTLEERTRKDTVKIGSTDGLEPENNDVGVGILPLASLGPAGLQPSMVNWVDVSESATLLTSQPTNDATTTGLFSISLSDLFPIMKNMALPLFAISQPVSIELVFRTQAPTLQDQGAILCRENSSVAPGANAKPYCKVTAAHPNIKMLVDYLTFSDDRQQELLAQTMSSQGLVVPYDDILLSTSTTPALAAPGTGEQTIVRELGFSGKKVKSLVWADTPDQGSGGVTAGDYPFMGKYYSQAYLRPDEYQVRVNDLNKYNRPIVRESQKAHQLSRVFGGDFCVNNVEYSNDACVDKTNWLKNQELMAGHTTGASVVDCQGNPIQELPVAVAGGTNTSVHNKTFVGLQHFYGCDLTTDPSTGEGQLIGQKPILLERKIYRSAADYGQRTTRCWGTYERTMVLRNGIVSVTA
jgi:hypothetical protein